MSGLFSKVLAGGVSAGIFLLWWPAHVTAQGGEWLFIRGILWSLAFEILMLAYSPLETAIMGAVREREPRALRGPRPARILTFAAVAIAVPLVMLSGAKPPSTAPARAAAAPAQKVIVKREIVKREVVVRRVNKVVRVPGPTVTTTAPAAAPVATSATTPTATKPAAKTTPKTATSGQVVSSSTKDAPATRTTRPATTASREATTTPATTPAATASSSASATPAASGSTPTSATNGAAAPSTSAAGS
jgi:hypothetical protein